MKKKLTVAYRQSCSGSARKVTPWYLIAIWAIINISSQQCIKMVPNPGDRPPYQALEKVVTPLFFISRRFWTTDQPVELKVS